MVSSRRTTMALALLLAVLSQPAWAIAHVAIHDHLAHDPHHRGETDGHHHDADAPDHHGARSPDESTPRATGDEHRHDHDHLDATFVRTVRSSDGDAFAAIPAPGLRWVAPLQQRPAWREGQPPRASPDPPDDSRPRAPPHA